MIWNKIYIRNLHKTACILVKEIFFTPIQRNSLRTGIKRKKKGKELYVMAAFKEDCQEFGDIVSQSTTNEDVFGNTITSVPLSTAMPEG